MSDEELAELAADIRAHGLLEPIVLLDGLVLDGRNRLRACEAAGVEPRFVDWDGTGDPAVWVISKNLKRRHLSTSQRAMVAAKLLGYYAGEAKERQQAAGGDRKSLLANLPEAISGPPPRPAAAPSPRPRSSRAAWPPPSPAVTWRGGAA